MVAAAIRWYEMVQVGGSPARSIAYTHATSMTGFGRFPHFLFLADCSRSYAFNSRPESSSRSAPTSHGRGRSRGDRAVAGSPPLSAHTARVFPGAGFLRGARAGAGGRAGESSVSGRCGSLIRPKQSRPKQSSALLVLVYRLSLALTKNWRSF